MKRLINWLLGYVEVRAEGAFPERLLNLCAQNRLAFWGLSWGDETSFTFRIRLKDLPRLRQYAQWAMCALHEAGRRGGLAALLRWRRSSARSMPRFSTLERSQVSRSIFRRSGASSSPYCCATPEKSGCSTGTPYRLHSA